MTPISDSNLAIAKKVDKCRFIILSGTSSSGKTSIMSAFCRNQQDKVRLGVDDFNSETYQPGLIKDHLPEDYLILSQVFEDIALFEVCNPDASIDDLLMKRPEFLKSGATAEEKEAVKNLLADRSVHSFHERFVEMVDAESDKINEPHFNAILDWFNKGNTVVFDTTSPGEFFEIIKERGVKIEATVHHLLVYLPLPTLLNRVEGRNKLAVKQGNLGNLRPVSHVMRDFTRHYKIATESDKVVAVLKRSEIETLFNKYADQIQADKQSYGVEFTLDDFLTHFQFGEGISEVSITTDFRMPQGVLYSGAASASESAYQLRTHTFTRI
jgi:GTPase SAR1 family protein